ncbi:hypothetical protein LY632_02680 [Erythrobacter sp. SDW2]|uniref:hypothetical protein n=1 Tax=Erythrobacter sp. SDW2 TaxID=2907154 RepID=UPI001F33706A|nr:hypothetical protein [Erythrobacter sp. SDW2]UIP07324.1 hypothetical protein LY632_02680 [Erythrobacter sp. SDW2]
MSLSTLSRAALVCLLLVISALVGLIYGPAIARYVADAQNSTTVDAEIDSRAIVYRLEQDKPVTFVFSQPVDQVRLLAQTAVGRQSRADPAGFVYTLEVRLFSGTGEEVLRQQFSLHSDAPDTVYATGENWRFFRNRPEMVAGMDDVVVAAPSPAVRAEWRLVDADPKILAVDIRVYERQPLLASNAITSFHRRSAEEQAKLAEANAFPPDMLTGEEIANITANMWRPLGPIGIAGRDYRPMVLYEGTRRPRRGEDGG